MAKIKKWPKKKKTWLVKVDEEFNKVLDSIQEEQKKKGEKVMSKAEITRVLIERFDLAKVVRENVDE